MSGIKFKDCRQFGVDYKFLGVFLVSITYSSLCRYQESISFKLYEKNSHKKNYDQKIIIILPFLKILLIAGG